MLCGVYILSQSGYASNLNGLYLLEINIYNWYRRRSAVGARAMHIHVCT